MSFRARLTAFFIVIVIVPMVAVSVVLFRLVTDSARGQSDARLSQGLVTVSTLNNDVVEESERAGREIAESPELAEALASDDRRRIAATFTRLASETGVSYGVMRLRDGPTVTTAGAPGVAGAQVMLVSPEGAELGVLEVSALSASEFVRRARRLTKLEGVLEDAGQRTLATTLDGVGAEQLPARGDVDIRGERYRLRRLEPVYGFQPGEELTFTILGDESETENNITKDSVFVAGLLVAFLILAFAFALTVSRALQAQIARLLEAAQRLGSGELSIEVPTEGNDEFAALGSEFNAMARQLEARLEELHSERTRLQHAIRRVGESFATGLDRHALLDVVVQTAVDGVGADAGRATVREQEHGPLVESARAGNLTRFKSCLHAVEAAVLDVRDSAETRVGDATALAHPLGGADGKGAVVGIVSVARTGRSFTEDEKELFHYLASQAAVSIQNVGLHEAVQRQAVTDELTGLFNHRRFQEVMSIEVERSRRYQQGLGLVMLDIDNFKSVNDTYGHIQGDVVLKAVADVLRESCREIDEPARYGGEEMAVALPGTDLEGTVLFAERLRQSIEALEIPRVDDGGHGSIRVTASLGAAALPESAEPQKSALVAAADTALYQAKRAGKNRVVKAG